MDIFITGRASSSSKRLKELNKIAKSYKKIGEDVPYNIGEEIAKLDDGISIKHCTKQASNYYEVSVKDLPKGIDTVRFEISR